MGNDNSMNRGVRIDQPLPNQKQIDAALKCPNKCDPGMEFQKIPKPGKGFLSLSVCLQCGAWWRVNEDGEIVERKQFWLESAVAENPNDDLKLGSL